MCVTHVFPVDFGKVAVMGYLGVPFRQNITTAEPSALG